MDSRPSLSALAGFPNPLQDLLWGPLRESFGLTAEQWQRLTEVVTLHMALDRFLFLRVTLGLTVVAGDRANVVRNRLLHYDVKRGIDAAPEIASPEAFRAFAQRAVRAWQCLADYLMPLIERAAEEPEGDPSPTSEP
jgi:hypothetical protein